MSCRDDGVPAVAPSQSGEIGQGAKIQSKNTSAQAVSNVVSTSSIFSTKSNEDMDDFDPRGIFTTPGKSETRSEGATDLASVRIRTTNWCWQDDR